VKNLTQLRTLNISDCSFTDAALFALAEHRSDTLQTLCAFNLENITGAGINSVLEKCHQLHSLAIAIQSPHVFEGLNLTLLGNITTLHALLVSTNHCKVIFQKCVRLQQLRLDCSFSSVRGLSESGAFYSETLPALRILSIHKTGKKSNESKVLNELDLVTLQALRPKLRIVMESSENWDYDFMKLPV